MKPPSQPSLHLASAIRAVLEDRKLLPFHLAQRAGLGSDTVYNLLNNKTGVSLYTLERLAQGLKMKPSKLLAKAESYDR